MGAQDPFQEALRRLKTIVFKNRIRLKDFFIDFDKLRTGWIWENQFLAQLNGPALGGRMKQDQLQTLADAYRRKETSNLYKVDYRSFCDEVDKVFTLRELEKTPLTLVPAEPYELLDKTRYDFCSKELGNGKDYQVDLLLDNLLQSCRMRGMEVKPFFDEVAQDVVNHVRIPQFKQCLTVGLGFRDLTEQQQSLLVEKYLDDEYGDLVNYAAFARRVDPLA